MDKIERMKHINLLELVKPNALGAVIAPEAKENRQIAQVVALGNYRSYLIANVLIVGQYNSVFESIRKSSQEHLACTKDWQQELKILSYFWTAFNECNHKITDMFF